MSEKIELTEPLIILSDPNGPFLPFVQSQKEQRPSKNLTTQLQPSLAPFSYQKSNKSDQINQQILAEQEQTKQWTLQEEKILVKLHNLKGNRWVQISLILNQLYLYNRRSDNSVKNHFHSKLRRGARKINNYIEEEQKNCFKSIRNGFLAKIVQASEGVTVNNLNEKTQRAVISYEIKNFILSASDFDENKITDQEKDFFKITLQKMREFQALSKAKPKFIKTNGGIRYKGKEIKTLIKENQIKQKQKNQKNQKQQVLVEANKTQAEYNTRYSQPIQNLQGNYYHQMPLYYIYQQQQMSYPFYNMPLLNFPTAFTPIQAPSSFFPIQDYPTQSTLGPYIYQNTIQEDDSRGSILNS